MAGPPRIDAAPSKSTRCVLQQKKPSVMGGSRQELRSSVAAVSAHLGDWVGMDCDGLDPDLVERSVRLLVDLRLLDVVESVVTVNHSAWSTVRARWTPRGECRSEEGADRGDQRGHLCARMLQARKEPGHGEDTVRGAPRACTRAANHSPPEHGVLAVESRTFCVRDEELRAVAVGARVGHRHDAALVVPQVIHDLIFELVTPDRLAALASAGWVPRLHHESFDVSVNQHTVVVVARCQCKEILARLGHLRPAKRDKWPERQACGVNETVRGDLKSATLSKDRKRQRRKLVLFDARPWTCVIRHYRSTVSWVIPGSTRQQSHTHPCSSRVLVAPSPKDAAGMIKHDPRRERERWERRWWKGRRRM